jgi:hypothetical protein
MLGLLLVSVAPRNTNRREASVPLTSLYLRMFFVYADSGPQRESNLTVLCLLIIIVLISYIFIYYIIINFGEPSQPKLNEKNFLPLRMFNTAALY